MELTLHELVHMELTHIGGPSSDGQSKAHMSPQLSEEFHGTALSHCILLTLIVLSHLAPKSLAVEVQEEHLPNSKTLQP